MHLNNNYDSFFVKCKLDFSCFSTNHPQKIIFLSQTLNFQVYFNIFLSHTHTLAIFNIISHKNILTRVFLPTDTHNYTTMSRKINCLREKTHNIQKKNNEKSYDRENELEMRTFERFSFNVKFSVKYENFCYR